MCGIYERVDEMNGGILEASLAISVSFWRFMGQQNKTVCLKKTTNYPRYFSILDVI
jgi:hypothetical protein